MTGSVLRTMIHYYKGDIRQINHALKVYSYAKTIGECEGLAGDELRVLEYGAVLHDIGIPESLRQCGSSQGKYQEELGVAVGRQLLEELSCPQEILERVLFLIGHHHSYGTQGGLPLQILFEADFLVNLEEGNLGSAEPADILLTHFKTEAGKDLLTSIYL